MPRMWIDRVILASDANPTYLEFWPLIAAAWRRRLGARATLLLVAGAEVRVDEQVGDVVRIDPIPDVDSGFQAQVVRLVAPALFGTQVSLLSDIDLLPLARPYFRTALAGAPDDALVIFRDGAYPPEHRCYPICYVAGRGTTFADVFGVSEPDKITRLLRQWADLGWGWHSDERLLYEHVARWPARTRRAVLLGHTVERRIDRSAWRYRRPLVRFGWYTDAHLPRPYSEFRREIDALAWWAGLR
jgi:hypothetical protein